jgi:hypothetical protein
LNQSRIEPRKLLVAVAEISWDMPADTRGDVPLKIPAKLEDTSVSGACLRVRSPLAIGSRLRVKWHREQFTGVIRNCRSDGNGFLLGILRDKDTSPVPKNANALCDAATPRFVEAFWEDFGGMSQHTYATFKSGSDSESSLWFPTPVAARTALHMEWQREPFSGVVQSCRQECGAYLVSIQHLSPVPHGLLASEAVHNQPLHLLTQRSDEIPGHELVAVPVQSTGAGVPTRPLSASHAAALADPGNRLVDDSKDFQTQGQFSSGQEGIIMRSTNLFSGLWSHAKSEASAPGDGKGKNVPFREDVSDPVDPASVPEGELLSCEDIYHAAGILTARSGYGINKIIDMLNSKHIRELPKEVKRASVLMALDAAGTGVDDVLQDASRRQHALKTYEAGQLQQSEEFEERITRENTLLQAELERVSAHYAERIKHNLDRAAKEKDSLRAWQTMKEQENQRISEAVALCSKPQLAEGVAEPRTDKLAALSSRVPAGTA